MTNQEIFDRVVTHLFTQAVRSTDASGECVCQNDVLRSIAAIYGLSTAAIDRQEQLAAETRIALGM